MLDIDGYVVTDDFFGKPYIDVDEERSNPFEYRYIHGGFEETGTRFSFHFLAPEQYQGRFIQPLEGAMAGSEHGFGPDGAMVSMFGGLDWALPLGAYIVETNQGHVGSELCPKGGNDGSIYGWRASAESARFAKYLATQIYGEAPRFGYVLGGSGGAFRSSQCIENVHDVWDGAMPFMGPTAAPPKRMFRGGGSPVFHALRTLGDNLADVVDAVEPGGSGNPFDKLDIPQRRALFDLYRAGYPRGVEWGLPNIAGLLGLWSWTADQWYEDDPSYYDEFWTARGYAGHDEPHLFAKDLIVDTTLTVKGLVTAGDLEAAPPGSEEAANQWSSIVAAMWGADLAMGIVVDKPDGDLLGASVKVVTGAAAGRQLYCVGVVGDTILVDGTGEAGNLRFKGVVPGDEVVVDNRRYLAYTCRYRHLIDPENPAMAHLAIDGNPIYPQRPADAGMTLSPHMGIPWYQGKFTGKVLSVQHTHDSQIWPTESRYDEGKDRWALRWTENAEHANASWIPVTTVPVPTSRLIDHKGMNEQNLHDLVAWVEDGIRPNDTTYTLEPGEGIQLPPTAAERGGIQPVVSATANGAARAEVKVGEAVTLGVDAEVPPDTGTIIAVDWDFDGTGTWPFRQDGIDGSETSVKVATDHAYDAPGTYFASARVTSHRDGDVNATGRRVENIARVRVVVG